MVLEEYLLYRIITDVHNDDLESSKKRFNNIKSFLIKKAVRKQSILETYP